mmetsp:Transcript_13554/g.20972  ORF Transcript_13554/g.20972 Transcript_13554/m.20972 type:complete len:1396 (-) Transcript_13554:44-4231(-)|eukprot:CAMPEP_0201511634 /NCGR_PEP_ID=MMETSP0161_2-20130828/4059_1 /ASSEMBLY_ACC=CAM_ASM_000251 /TAXON_ID=180227 /ORGANISM="Neoparamoeba aestuarina, Strain SoJaBio B1-5/56/2" /LENGTH=1395 /DNA_ID=CAMNT_0047907207 /DNA_START=117 /DNA_END=4304 /DNA_ORIENTATION=+
MAGLAPPRSLSSLVSTFEAGLFEEFLRKGQRTQRRSAPFSVEMLEKEILNDLKSVLGDAIELQVQGSLRKGTFWINSDVDVLIQTGEREVTREEQEIVTEKLKGNPVLTNVGLGRVAVHFNFTGVEVDLVFSNLTEVGKQQAVTPEVMEKISDPIVQLAVVALKLAMNEGQVSKVTSFLLENFAMHVQSFLKAESAMRLFVAISQAIVDTKGEILSSPFLQPPNAPKKQKKSLSPITLKNVAHRLTQSLHLFCLSRFFLKSPSPTTNGFSTVVQIEQWLRQTGDTGFPVLMVPGWMFGIPPPDDSPERLYCLEEDWFKKKRPSCPPREKIQEQFEAVVSARAFKLFNDSPLGRYILFPNRNRSKKPPSHVHLSRSQMDDEINELEYFARMGSPVARRMILARKTWLAGVQKLEEKEVTLAVEILAKSLFYSKSDGDPFSGWVNPEFEPVVKEAFERDPTNPDCAIVFTNWIILTKQQWGEARALLEPVVEKHPNHIGSLYRYITVCAHLPSADWDRLVHLTSRLIALEPDEPMHLYWKATYLRFSKNNSAAIKFYEEFLQKASPEGRKVPIAYKDKALLRVDIPADQTSLDRAKEVSTRFLAEYEKALEAEKKVLPMLLASNSPHPGDEWYQLIRMGDGGNDSQGASQFMTTKIRESANEAFQQGHFSVAVEGYNDCLMVDPHDYRALSNRSLGYLQLNRYTEAEIDAQNLVAMKPEWEKSYKRLIQARLAKRKLADALEACQSGLLRFPNSEELKKFEADAKVMLQEKGDSGSLNPKDMACYSEVKYKQNCKVVDSDGGGDYLSLDDALVAHAISEKPEVSLIIVGCGPFFMKRPLLVSSSSVQIIGGGTRPPTQTKGKKRKKQKKKQQQPKESKEPLSDQRRSILKIEGNNNISMEFNLFVAVNAKLDLQHLNLHAYSHCVFAKLQAVVTVKNCSAKSQLAASFSAMGGAKLVVSHCMVPHKSHGGLVVEGAKATFEDCRFKGSAVLCLGVRQGSKCSFLRCKIAKSQAQALCIGTKGEVDMEDCQLLQCGQAPNRSGVLLEEGILRMKNCLVKGHKTHGIVVQGTGEGRLFMDGCEVVGNPYGGVAVFQGSAEISNCVIRENGHPGGILFGDLPRRCFVRRCKVSAICNSLFSKNVTLEDNIIDNPNSSVFEGMKQFSPQLNSNSPNPKSSFQEIPQHYFNFDSLRDIQLRELSRSTTRSMLDQSPQVEPSMFSFTANNVVPPRTTPDSQLQPTTVKKAWKKTDVRSVGKYIEGVVRLPGKFITSHMTVLVDEEGTAVFLALYNLPGIRRQTTPRQAQRVLPVGTTLRIKEPYLRRFLLSESIGIRVENPADLDINTSTSSTICHHCGKVAEKGEGGEVMKLKKCGNCRGEAYYCGRDCQKGDWGFHKLFHK